MGEQTTPFMELSWGEGETASVIANRGTQTPLIRNILGGEMFILVAAKHSTGN